MADDQAAASRWRRAAILVASLGVGVAAFTYVDGTSERDSVRTGDHPSVPAGASVLSSTITAPHLPEAQAASPATFAPPAAGATAIPHTGPRTSPSTTPPPTIIDALKIENTTTTTIAAVDATTTTTEAPTSTTADTTTTSSTDPSAPSSSAPSAP